MRDFLLSLFRLLTVHVFQVLFQELLRDSFRNFSSKKLPDLNRKFISSNLLGISQEIPIGDLTEIPLPKISSKILSDIFKKTCRINLKYRGSSKKKKKSSKEYSINFSFDFSRDFYKKKKNSLEFLLAQSHFAAVSSMCPSSICLKNLYRNSTTNSSRILLGFFQTFFKGFFQKIILELLQGFLENFF